jgi:hypothetical protein
MIRRPSPLAAFAVAVVTVALWLGAATPGLATATEAPSPPALGAPTACATHPPAGHHTVGACPAIVRSSSSAVVTSLARRLPVGLPGPAMALVVAGAASAVGLLAWRRSPRPVLGPVGARAPPVSAS